MNAKTTRPPFPRRTLFAAGSVIGFALLAAIVGRLTGPVATIAPSVAVDTRDLRFEDRPDGSVVILDAATDALVEVAPPGTNGFLRATLRGLARARRADDVGSAAPFHLTHWADGRLTLDDPTTQRRVEMAAFGVTNAEVFARLMTERRATP